MSSTDRLHIYFDACFDDSIAIVKSITDKRLVVVGSSENNLGVRRTLNILLDSVETPLTSRMDADDICFPWRFGHQRKLSKTADLVFSTALVFGPRLRPLPLIPQLPISLKGFPSRASLVFSNPYVHPSMTARTRVLKDLGGYTETFAQDHGLWLRAAIQGFEIVRSALPSIAYRFHHSQFTAGQAWRTMRDQDTRIPKLQEELERALCADLGFLNRFEILQELYRQVPLMRLEHQGLPNWLKKI